MAASRISHPAQRLRLLPWAVRQFRSDGVRVARQWRERHRLEPHAAALQRAVYQWQWRQLPRTHRRRARRHIAAVRRRHPWALGLQASIASPKGHGNDGQPAYDMATRTWFGNFIGTVTAIGKPWVDVTAAKYAGGADPLGVADSRAAIVQAQADANAHGWALFFPSGVYVFSDFVDVLSGTYWIGVGPNPGVPQSGSSLEAIGTGKGVLRARPGTPGNLTVNNWQLKVIGLTFTGGATTGHLVTIARISHVGFINCDFNNTSGTGLKDDNATAVGAAGVYGYSCEVVSFISCTFQNNLNASGAGVTLEDGCHGWGWTDACHFNGNTYGVRCTNFTAGKGTGGLYFGIDFFFANVTAFFCDVGAVHTVSVWGTWFEAHTAVNPAGQIVDGGSSAGPLQAWKFDTCTMNFTVAGTKLVVGSNVQLDGSGWIACRFNGSTTTSLFVHSFVNGGNYLIGGVLSGTINNIFVGNDPSTSGYDFVAGFADAAIQSAAVVATATSLRQKLVALTDAAFVVVDFSKGNDFFLSAGGSRTINNPTNFPPAGYAGIVYITIKNNTGGAIVTTWSAAYHLAAAWVDPAAGKQRTILFRWDGSVGVAYEITRDTADLTP